MITPSRVFGATNTHGGGLKSLDSIPSNMIKQDDYAIVSDGQNFYFYTLDYDLGGDENVPFIIKPDDVDVSLDPSQNAKRWVLISTKYFTDNIILPADKYIKVNEIQAVDGVLRIVSSEGITAGFLPDGTLQINNIVVNEQLHVTNTGVYPPFVVDSTMMVNNLNVDRIHGYTGDEVVFTDGSNSLTEPLAGVDPVNDADFTTKSFVENLVGQSTNVIQKGVIDLVQSTDNITVTLSEPLTNYSISLILENTVDVPASMYEYMVVRKTPNEFDVSFGAYINSPNYKLNWVVHPID